MHAPSKPDRRFHSLAWFVDEPHCPAQPFRITGTILLPSKFFKASLSGNLD
jgi:hypothetical protein